MSSLTFKMEDVWGAKLEEFLARLQLEDPRRHKSRETRFSMRGMHSISSLDVNVQERTSATFIQSYLQSIAFAIVIEDILEKIDLIKLNNHLPQLNIDIDNKPLEERIENMGIKFRVPDPTITKEKRERTAEFAKLNKDLTFIEEIFKQTQANLVEQNVHQTFLNRVREYITRMREEAEVTRTNSVYIKEIIALKTLILNERKCSEMEIRKAMSELGNLKDELEDLVYLNKIKEHYVVKWEKARVEQNRYQKKLLEDAYLHKIAQSQMSYQSELRVTEEITLYLQEAILSTKTLFNEWTDKYEREIETRDIEINKLKTKIAATKTEIEAATEKYEERKRAIEIYLEHKEIKRQEAELLAARNTAAIKIQAWWRGVMVRKCLGPYKKKKGKSKKVNDKKLKKNK